MENRSKRAIKTPKRFDDEAFEITPKQQTPKHAPAPESSKQTPTPTETVQPKSIIKVKLMTTKVRPPQISLPRLTKPKATLTSPKETPKDSPRQPEPSKLKESLREVKEIPKIKEPAKPKDITRHKDTPRPKESLKPREPTKTKELLRPKEVYIPEREYTTVLQRPRTKRPRTPPVFIDVIPNVVLPFWDARTAAEDHEDDNVKELVHCQCGIDEELGLMVQCETCLTWQHAHCLGIDKPEDAPDGYTCKACSDPRFARDSRKCAYDQDWLTKGRMKRFPCDRSPASEKEVSTMKQINHLISESLRIQKLIHSVRVKTHILENAADDDPELRLFRVQWTAGDVLDSSGTDAGPEDCRANLKSHISKVEEYIETQLTDLDKQLASLEEELKDRKHDTSLESLKNDLETLRSYIQMPSYTTKSRLVHRPSPVEHEFCEPEAIVGNSTFDEVINDSQSSIVET